MIPEPVPISRRLTMNGDRSLTAVFHLYTHTHARTPPPGGRAFRGLWAFLLLSIWLPLGFLLFYFISSFSFYFPRVSSCLYLFFFFPL